MDPIHHMTRPGPERKRGWGHYLGVEGEPPLLFRIKFKGRKKKKKKTHMRAFLQLRPKPGEPIQGPENMSLNSSAACFWPRKPGPSLDMAA